MWTARVLRAVHIAEVNPEKVNPSVVMPGNKKVEALDLQGLPSGGDSWTRTNDPFDVNDVPTESCGVRGSRAMIIHDIYSQNDAEMGKTDSSFLHRSSLL